MSASFLTEIRRVRFVAAKSLSLRTAPLSRGNLGRYVPPTKAILRVQEIVRGTEQTDVRGIGGAELSPRIYMVEFEKHARRAASSIGGDERALTAISRMDLSPYLRCQVPSAFADRRRTGLARGRLIRALVR